MVYVDGDDFVCVCMWPFPITWQRQFAVSDTLCLTQSTPPEAQPLVSLHQQPLSALYTKHSQLLSIDFLILHFFFFQQHVIRFSATFRKPLSRIHVPNSKRKWTLTGFQTERDVKKDTSIFLRRRCGDRLRSVSVLCWSVMQDVTLSGGLAQPVTQPGCQQQSSA